MLFTIRKCVGFAALVATALAADKTASATASSASSEATPCVAHSLSGAFFDLRPDTAVIAEKNSKVHKGVPTEDYVARGWDLGYNFTLNICGAVVKPVDSVVGLKESQYKNVSAWYEKSGKVYSLGLQSSALVSRGRKLVLQYSNGSPCKAVKSDKRGIQHEGAQYKHYEDDPKDLETTTKQKSTSAAKTSKEDDKDAPERRKSATISFLCDRDPSSSFAAASFVGVDPDECSYFFEVRSQHACAGAEPHKPGSVGPGGVFVIIFFIAVLVYLLGGVFYQRTVAHARGWRQLPNYSLWSGIWDFLSDTFTILVSSCARCMPGRRGYRTLSISPNGRGRNREDENRLIDQLDEEWDD